MASADREALLFLNEAEAATVDALAAAIVPGDESDPGAREAGVVTYIDRGLAGFFREQQGFYREALRELDRHCAKRYDRRFVQLGLADQNDVLAELDGWAQAGTGMLGKLFALVREHTVQGMFCDPAYGGNRDGVGWRLVGFPGAQWGYEPEHMARHFDASRIPLSTLADLRARGGAEA